MSPFDVSECKTLTSPNKVHILQDRSIYCKFSSLYLKIIAVRFGHSMKSMRYLLFNLERFSRTFTR